METKYPEAEKLVKLAQEHGEEKVVDAIVQKAVDYAYDELDGVDDNDTEEDED